VSRGSLRATLAAAVLFAGCAALPPEAPQVAECRANFLGLDEKVDAADARNGGAYRIPGFPYLRANRFLASYRYEADGPQFDVWVGHLRALDLAARESELRNLGWDEPAEELRHLDRCGKQWAARDLRDPERREQLREAAKVPDDYSLVRRTLGFYPVAVPFLNMGINNFNDSVREDYARPWTQLDAPGKTVLWRPDGAAPVGAAHGRDWNVDPLGIPTIKPELWQQLLRRHAPQWQIETDAEFDRPGAPVLRDGKPTADVARPVTYAHGTYTRFGHKVLPQLVYTVWFTERPKEGRFDSYGGALDGVVWRVTLDTDGAPLLYDTIHACGCYHYYYMPERAQSARGAKPLVRKPQGGFWDEPVLFPQEPVPDQPFAIRLASRTHYVRRLVPLHEAPAGEQREYRLADYDELLSLPDGKDGRKSLFCEDGLVCGTERLERFWLWPAGIKSAGAMRQWGRHPTSFVGRSHFDEARLLDRLFEAP
jgi:hypothetical protein